MKTTELQNFIRSGGFAWPGGYPLALLMADGEVIDARAARENYRLIRRALTRFAPLNERPTTHYDPTQPICVEGA